MKLFWIMNPPVLNSMDDFSSTMLFQFDFLPSFFVYSPSLYVFVSTVYLLAVSLWFNFLMIKHRLLSQKNYIPSFAILLFTSFFAVTSILSVQLISITLILMAMFRMMDMYQQSDTAKQTLYIGLLASFAVLLYFPSVLFVPMLLVGVLTMKTFNARDFAAYIIGLMLPFYFTLGIGFLLSDEKSLFSNLQLGISLPTSIAGGYGKLTVLLFLLCLLVFAMYNVANENSRSNMAVKKKWSVFYQILFVSILGGLFSSSFPGVSWILTLLPVSIILSKSFMSDRQKVNTFTFYATLVLLVIVQWFQSYFK